MACDPLEILNRIIEVEGLLVWNVRKDIFDEELCELAQLTEEEAETLSLFLSGQTFYCHELFTNRLVGWQIDIEPHEEATIDEHC